jgi:hypothetical protein
LSVPREIILNLGWLYIHQKAVQILFHRRIAVGIAMGFPDPDYPLNGSRGRGRSRGRLSIGLTDYEAAEAGLHLNPVNGGIEK